jgi:ATP diphosphatase
LIRVTDHRPENTAPDQRLITALLDVMAALRTPGTGCPWDLEQTLATIAP